MAGGSSIWPVEAPVKMLVLREGGAIIHTPPRMIPLRFLNPASAGFSPNVVRVVLELSSGSLVPAHTYFIIDCAPIEVEQDFQSRRWIVYQHSKEVRAYHDFDIAAAVAQMR